MKKTLLFPLLSLLMLPLAAFGAADGVARFHDVGFGGDTSKDTWIAIRKTMAESQQPGAPAGSWGSHQSLPGMTYWTTALLSNGATGSGNAEIYRIANGDGGGAPYLAGSSMYFGGISDPLTPGFPLFGGTVGIRDASPVADLKTVGLQIQINDAFGHDFTIGGEPLLYINGNFSDALSANHVVSLGTVVVGEGTARPSNNRYLYFQWDLGGVDFEITAFEIQFSATEHVTVTNLRLDQSNESMSVAAIPEPSTWSMIAFCAVGGGLYLRRRQRKALAA